MKSTYSLILVLLCASTQANADETAQQTLTFSFDQVTTLEDAAEKGFPPEVILSTIQKSKADLIKKFGFIEAANFEPISISLHEPVGLSLETDLENGAPVDCCNTKVIAPTPAPPSFPAGKQNGGGVLYISWGYNRDKHSNSDIYIETPDGNITIRDAVGEDRGIGDPFWTYLRPDKFTIPQYNIRLGYWIDKNWGVELGGDHMKWIFDPNQEYKIEGNYLKDLWVRGVKRNFDQITAGNDASFLLLEHSDGYNYAFLGVVYREKLFQTARFGADAIAGTGAGLFIPKTRTRIADQPNTAQYRDVDNKFHVAGYGAHIDLRIRLKYIQKNGVTYYIEPSARGVVGKIDNALFLGNDTGKISQSPIYSFEKSVSIGTEIPLKTFRSKKNRAKRRL